MNPSPNENEFVGHTIDGQPACNWKGVYREAAKFPNFAIKVIDLDRRVKRHDGNRQISVLQNDYLHAVPFKNYSEATGCSLLEAKRHLKLFAGGQWFRRHYDDDRNQKGDYLFECLYGHCKAIFRFPAIFEDKYVCPNCSGRSIATFFMPSISTLSTKECMEFMENCITYLAELGIECELPNINYKTKKRR